MNLETVIGVIGIVSALFTLATTRLTYKAAAARARPEGEARRHRVLRVIDRSVRIRAWNMRRVKWFFALPSVAYAVVVPFFIRDLYIGILCISLAVFVVIMIGILRDQPPSRTMKTAEFSIKGKREEILEDCLTALEQMGARVGTYNAGEGVIEACRKITWRSFGEIITIEVGKRISNSVSVRVTSDVLQPSALFDFGTNARNISQIKTALLG
jgi:hypothetical protein